MLKTNIRFFAFAASIVVSSVCNASFARAASPSEIAQSLCQRKLGAEASVVAVSPVRIGARAAFSTRWICEPMTSFAELYVVAPSMQGPLALFRVSYKLQAIFKTGVTRELADQEIREYLDPAIAQDLTPSAFLGFKPPLRVIHPNFTTPGLRFSDVVKHVVQLPSVEGAEFMVLEQIGPR